MIIFGVVHHRIIMGIGQIRRHFGHVLFVAQWSKIADFDVPGPDVA